MSTNIHHDSEKRVLLVAPTAKDAQVTRALLTAAGLTCVICTSIRQLNEQVEQGAGAVLLTEEAITARDIGELLQALDKQPSWSELPVVMLMRGGVDSPVAARVLRSLRNVTLLERPAPMRSVVSAVQVAVRGRERQYQMREQIQAIRRAELRARELQQQLEIAIDASELGTFHCEVPLNKIVWNDRCKAHFWLAPEAEVDFDLFYSILHPDDRDRTRKAVEDCVKDGKLYDIEYRTVSPSGQVRWVRATGRTYYNERREPVRFDGTTQDITERKNAEQERNQLLESERAARQEAERAGRMKDEFLATLSHELRTPLNAIFGWTQLLKRGKDDPEILAEGIDVIDRNVRMQTQLIEDLLDMSRIISGKVRLDVQQVELPEVINAALQGVQPAADAKGIRLQRVIDPAAGPVSGDPGRLQQVLWNLLTNAIKFTPRHGRIHVLLQRVNSHVQLSVSDTGEGISPEFLPHLFERFSQADASMRRKHGGLGIGLSLVKSLVELHGGTVAASSPGPGLGATFSIDLPLRLTRDLAEEAVHPRTKSHPAEETRELPKLHGVKVLVVDDEPDARELVRRMLIERQAVPRLAASAKEAQEILLTFKPDVILSDIGMPYQDGYEFMREVRGRGNCTPAIALTAFARSEDRIRSIEAGYQTHLPKPVEADELLAVIASLARPAGNGNHA